MIDINHIINQEIERAYMRGRYDLAKEVTIIASKGGNALEWNESRGNAIQHCYDAQDEYLKSIIGE